MPYFGSHLSIAGGYYKAADQAAELGMRSVQIFTKNNNQWAGKPLGDDELAAFKSSVQRGGLFHAISHDSYLINLASPDDELWERSLQAYIVEIQRATAFGLSGVVMHPGSHLQSTPEEGLNRIIQALDRVHAETPSDSAKTLLETTAGQGTNLGWRFEHLASILDNVKQPERCAVCVDSCHIHAAGYKTQTPEDYASTMAEFDRLIGVNRIAAWHLNDSVKPLGSRVDRHAHLGEGTLGLEPFWHIVNDPRFAEVPMILETAKEQRDGEEMDAVNLRVLNSLLGAKYATMRDMLPKTTTVETVAPPAKKSSPKKAAPKKSAAKKAAPKSAGQPAASKRPTRRKS